MFAIKKLAKGTWTKPENGWYKLNTDGSVYPNSAAGGGLLRDDNGNWIVGFCCKLGDNRTSGQAELLALRLGLRIAKERKVEKVIVETDSTEVVHLVYKVVNTSKHPMRSVIEECKELLKKPWTLMHVKRGGNKCADALAKKGHGVKDEEVIFKTAPKGLLPLLKNDMSYNQETK